MIRLLIADDHLIVREGIKRYLTDMPDMTVVAEAASGEEVIALARTTEVDVALLDLSMPGPGFLQLMAQLKEVYPAMAILILSMQPEEMYAVRALRAGAKGYVPKDHSPDELASAIRLVAAGKRFLSPSLAESLALGIDPTSDRPRYEGLSNREFQVLVRLGAGMSVKEIAAQLALSPKTVSTYRVRILEKLELETTADVIRYAIEHELEP